MKIPKFTAPAKVEKIKPPAVMGRPKSEIVKMREEIQRVIVMEHGLDVVKAMVRISEDSAHPKQIEALKWLGDKALPNGAVDDMVKQKETFSLKVIAPDGTVSIAVSNASQAPSEEHTVIDMGKVEEDEQDGV